MAGSLAGEAPSPAPFSCRASVSLVSGQITLEVWSSSSSQWASAHGNVLLDTELTTVRMSLFSSVWPRYHNTQLSSSKGVWLGMFTQVFTAGGSGDYLKSCRTWGKQRWVSGTDLSLATLSPPITEGMSCCCRGDIGVRMRVSLYNGDSSGL